MRATRPISLGLTALALLSPAAAAAHGPSRSSAALGVERPPRFQRVATLPNYLNGTDPEGETVSEIVASTQSGNTLVYTDSLLREIGFIDIRHPAGPVSSGKLGVGGEPTSVGVLGEGLALVAVNTGESFTEPSGHLAVIDIAARRILAELPLGGQPDSVAISPSGRFAAIAIENQRDDEVVIDDVEGGLPQAPGGFVAIVDITSAAPSSWNVRRVELGSLSDAAPDDPEPEFVDINAADEVVVSLQENDHIVVIDLPSGLIVDDFSAGTVAISGVDATEDGIISLRESLELPREPDAVAWVPGPSGVRIATANEGDLFGGSRGFSIFERDGSVAFDSASSLEEIAVRHGHYPEARSDAKGTEPEAIELGRFGDTDYLFVGSERGSFVAVYTLDASGLPQFVQLLPAPLGPEGVHAIGSRGLLVVSGEEDDPSFGVRSSVMIYRLGDEPPSYPQIVSADDDTGKPIPWSALSGLAALPGQPDTLLGVWDGFYSEARILTIDAARAPAVITSSLAVTGSDRSLDPEGIAVAPDGSYWIASEGDDEARTNLLVQVDPAGAVLQTVGLPADIEACRAATENRETLAAGFEGVAAVPTPRGYVLVVPQQRGWDFTTPECEAEDDDPFAENPAEPSLTRLWIYDPAAASWSHVPYALEPIPENAGWVGLSEISAVPGGFVLIERDDLSGDFARHKRLVHVGRSALRDGVRRADKRSFDLIPSLLETHGWISDKPEGLAIGQDGRAFVVTDNDGVDDWSGETWFLRLGSWRVLFR